MLKQSKWFANTVVLSNFAFAHAVSLLEVRYGKKMKIPEDVCQEIMNGIIEGYQSLNSIVNAINGQQFEKITLNSKERKEYFSLAHNLGSGESACIAAAINRKGAVISDDRAARSICNEKNIPYTGTIGILKACYLDKSLTLSDADSILKIMITNGFYSPVRTISDILNYQSFQN
ncbi:MAG: hypothetical protein H0V82_05635 [Candidatus Protochlamydia sp.]|nr:hypothetical protein [Candidatus Protochlamydia sp.]